MLTRCTATRHRQITLHDLAQATYKAHVPEPPGHDPDQPPDIPPPGRPEEDIDLPPRESPEPLRDPEKPRPV